MNKVIRLEWSGNVSFKSEIQIPDWSTDEAIKKLLNEMQNGSIEHELKELLRDEIDAVCVKAARSTFKAEVVEDA